MTVTTLNLYLKSAKIQLTKQISSIISHQTTVKLFVFSLCFSHLLKHFYHFRTMFQNNECKIMNAKQWMRSPKQKSECQTDTFCLQNALKFTKHYMPQKQIFLSNNRPNTIREKVNFTPSLNNGQENTIAAFKFEPVRPLLVLYAFSVHWNVQLGL